MVDTRAVGVQVFLNSDYGVMNLNEDIYMTNSNITKTIHLSQKGTKGADIGSAEEVISFDYERIEVKY